MIKLKQGIFGSAILLGSMVLTGCGTSEHPVAIAPSHHSQTVSPSTSASSWTSSTMPSSAVPSRSSSTTSNTESAILYTRQQRSFIMQAAQSVGLPAVDVPMHGFGSQLQYTQRLLTSEGVYMLLIQYNNFSVQESTKPMLTGGAVLRTVPLTILGSSVAGTWNQPASASGSTPPLTFHIHDMYYLVQGGLSQTQIDTIAESFTSL